MKSNLMALIMICMVVSPSNSQQVPSAKFSVAEMIAALHSEQWTQRSSAYDLLRNNSGAMKEPQVREALLNLLDRENHFIESTNRSPMGPSVDAKYGEGYAEYIGELGDTVDTFADWNDSRQVCIFVHEPYNPEFRFASKIADHATATIPCLFQMSKSDIESDRAQSIPVLAHVLAKRKNVLDRQTATAVHQAILDGLQDPSATVRSETIASVGNFGSKDLIPALTNIAVSDPASGRNSETNVQSFPLREAATKAIEAIKKRSRSSAQ